MKNKWKDGVAATVWSLFTFSIGIYLIARDNGSNIGSVYYGHISDFQLYSLNHQEFTYEDLLGKIWVINFQIENTPSLNPPVFLDGHHLYISDKQFKFQTGKTLIGELEYIKNFTLKNFHLNVDNIKDLSSIYILLDTSGNIRGYYNIDKRNDRNQLTKDIFALQKI